MRILVDSIIEESGRTVAIIDVYPAFTPRPWPSNASSRTSYGETARVGETPTADTSVGADAHGLDDASFSYQWIRNAGALTLTLPELSEVATH